MRIMLVAIALLVAGVLALAWQLKSEIGARHLLLQEISNLRSELADKSKRDALEFQAECASQAWMVFQRYGWKLGEPTKGEIADFESHYHPGMNKCFILLHVRSLTANSFTSSVLWDAHGQRQYAELNITYIGGVRHIATCELTPLHGEQRSCESEAEFKEFVARYME